MIELISASKDCNVRSFSAVLLKQNLGIFDKTFNKIPVNSQNMIKNKLLNQLKIEKDQNVTIQIAECISYLVCHYNQNEHNDWNELMPFLLKLATSTNEYERASFYIAINKLACNAIDILRLNNDKNMENFKNILISGLNDNKNKFVQETALNAIVSLLCGLSEINELNYFIDIVPLLFKNINNNNNDKTICNTLQSLQILAEGQPNFFINSMKPITECLVNIVKSNNLQYDTKKLSMTLLIYLLSCHSNQIQNILMDVAKQVIPLIFQQFLSNFNENIEINTPSDYDEQDNFQYGAEILPELIPIFGSEIFLNIIKQPVFDKGFNINNGDWKSTLIALKTIEVTLENCCDLYEHQLPQILNIVTKILSNNNSNPHNKYFALSVIKQLSVIYGDDKNIFLIPFHENIMKSFCYILANQPLSQNNNCVLIQVCDAIAHFIYIDEDNEVITKYSNDIINGLFNLLIACNNNDNTLELQSFILKAISVICSIIQDEFSIFYDKLMKYNVELLQKIFKKQITNDNNGQLRGRIMECIGGMLLVVDIDKCRNDAHNIIKFLLQFQKQEQNDPSSESYSFMMSLFASIAEALTNEFTPYLQYVIPPLIESAKKRTISVGINNDADDNNGGHIVEEEFGGIRFQINTAEMNEKVIAIQQFPRYAVCMEGELLTYVRQISLALKPVITARTLTSEARRHAIETMVPLANCLKCGLINKNLKTEDVNKWLTEFVSDIIPSLVEAMNSSDEVDEFSLICKTIQDLLDYIDINMFKNGQCISDITEQIGVAIKERQDRREINDEKSMDLLDTEIEYDVEADLADTLVDLITKLIITFGNNFLQIFDKYIGGLCIELISSLNHDNNNIFEEDQILSITMLTEIVRYSGNESNKYNESILKFARFYLPNHQTISSQIKQSICYFIGICALKNGLNVNNISNWLNLLKNIVNDDNSRNDENIDATENAISAIAKICKIYSNNNINIIIEWISMLPIINDNEEREFCNNYLLSILKNTNLLNDIIQNKNIKMIEKLIHIMAISIINNDKEKPQFQQLFNHLKSKCDINIIKKSISCLNNDLQKAFE